MKAGADPNKKNKNLWSPIHMACYFNQIEAINWMLDYNKTAK
jgi:ankyrin repeat protein